MPHGPLMMGQINGPREGGARDSIVSSDLVNIQRYHSGQRRQDFLEKISQQQ
jgi:hypothetical protein